MLAWQSPLPLFLDVGEADTLYVEQIYNPEAGPQGLIRWTGSESLIKFLGVGGGPWQAQLRFATQRKGGQPAPTVSLRDETGAQQLAQWQPSPDYQTYIAPSTASANRAGDLILHLRTAPTFAPTEAAGRVLGVALDWVQLTPGAGLHWPPLLLWLQLSGSTGLVALAALRLGGIRGALAAGLGLAGALSLLATWHRLWLTPFGGEIFWIAAGVAGAVWAIWAVLTYLVWVPATPAGSMRQRLAGVVLLITAAGSLVTFVQGMNVAYNAQRAADFRVMWEAAQRLNAKGDLYPLDQIHANPFGPVYKYPPVYAGLLRPLAALDYDTGAKPLWRSFLIGCYILAIIGLIAGVTRSQRPPPGIPQRSRAELRAIFTPATLLLIIVAGNFHPAVDAVNYGQPDPLILLLLVVSVLLWRQGTALAGGPLAVATAFKLYPGLLLGYWAVRREWRLLLGWGIGLVALSAVGLLLTTLDATLTYLTQVLPASGGLTAWVENQTVSGFVARLFTDDLRLTPFPTDLTLRANLLTGLTYGSAVLGLGGTLWLIARRPAPPASVTALLQLGLIITVSLLLLPVAWLHYFVVLLFPLAAGIVAVTRHRMAGGQQDRARTLLIVVCLVLGAVLLAYENIWWLFAKFNYGGIWKLVLSYKLYGGLLVAVGVGLAWRWMHNAEADEGGQAIK